MTDIQPITVAAYRLAEIADILARAQQIDFDPERDMPFVDVDEEIRRMNPDPSQRLHIAGILVSSPLVNAGQARRALTELESIGKVDVKRFIALIKRQIEVDEKHRADLYAVIADEQRKAAEAAEQAEALRPKTMLERIEQLEAQIAEKEGR